MTISRQEAVIRTPSLLSVEIARLKQQTPWDPGSGVSRNDYLGGITRQAQANLAARVGETVARPEPVYHPAAFEKEDDEEIVEGILGDDGDGEGEDLDGDWEEESGDEEQFEGEEGLLEVVPEARPVPATRVSSRPMSRADGAKADYFDRTSKDIQPVPERLGWLDGLRRRLAGVGVDAAENAMVLSDAERLEVVARRFYGLSFPEDPKEKLRVLAEFDDWTSERRIAREKRDTRLELEHTQQEFFNGLIEFNGGWIRSRVAPPEIRHALVMVNQGIAAMVLAGKQRMVDITAQDLANINAVVAANVRAQVEAGSVDSRVALEKSKNEALADEQEGLVAVRVGQKTNEESERHALAEEGRKRQEADNRKQIWDDRLRMIGGWFDTGARSTGNLVGDVPEGVIERLLGIADKFGLTAAKTAISLSGGTLVGLGVYELLILLSAPALWPVSFPLGLAGALGAKAVTDGIEKRMAGRGE